MPLPQIGTDADDGHVVAAIEADGLGVEIEWGCHTKSDAVDVADGDFLRYHRSYESQPSGTVRSDIQDLFSFTERILGFAENFSPCLR